MQPTDNLSSGLPATKKLLEPELPLMRADNKIDFMNWFLEENEQDLNVISAAQGFAAGLKRQREQSEAKSEAETKKLKERIAALEVLLGQANEKVAAVEDFVLVPKQFIEKFNTLAHNYRLGAIAPDYYVGNERDAYASACENFGIILGKMRDQLTGQVFCDAKALLEAAANKGQGKSKSITPA